MSPGCAGTPGILRTNPCIGRICGWVSCRTNGLLNALPAFMWTSLCGAVSTAWAFIMQRPRLMRLLRREIDENPAVFTRAANQALKAGFAIEGDCYAKPKKEGLPAPLDQLYNRKIWEFSKFEPGPRLLRQSLPAGDAGRAIQSALSPVPADDRRGGTGPGNRRTAVTAGEGGL